MAVGKNKEKHNNSGQQYRQTCKKSIEKKKKVLECILKRPPDELQDLRHTGESKAL